VSSIPVDVATVAHSHHMDDQAGVDDLVDDSEVANSHPIHRILPGQGNTPGRTRVVCKEIDGYAYPLSLSSGKCGDGLDRAPCAGATNVARNRPGTTDRAQGIHVLSLVFLHVV